MTDDNIQLKKDISELKDRVNHLQKTFGPITAKWQGGPAVLVVETEQDLPNYLQSDIRRNKSRCVYNLFSGFFCPFT